MLLTSSLFILRNLVTILMLPFFAAFLSCNVLGHRLKDESSPRLKDDLLFDQCITTLVV
jgi:hypothetical protein